MKKFKKWLCEKQGHKYRILTVDGDETTYICNRCQNILIIKNKPKR